MIVLKYWDIWFLVDKDIHKKSRSQQREGCTPFLSKQYLYIHCIRFCPMCLQTFYNEVLFSQDIPKNAAQESTANGTEDLSLYILYSCTFCFISSSFFLLKVTIICLHSFQDVSQLKELFPNEDEADLECVLKCSFNLEHAIDTFINRSVGEYQSIMF